MNDLINKDLVTAMKSQDKFKTSVLRMLKSELKKEEINKKHTLSDEETIAVIKKQVKIRNTSIEEYKKYNKTEEIKNLELENSILSSYLPEELSKEQLEEVITEVFNDLKPTSIKDIGRVLKEISSRVGSKADMSKVSAIVKEKLS